MSFLKRLRALNVPRCENSYGHSLHSWSNMEWGCAAAGEMGELCNILKKIDRELAGIGGARLAGIKQAAVSDEIADVIIYLDLLAARWEIDLEEIITVKFNRDSVKVKFLQTLEIEDAT